MDWFDNWALTLAVFIPVVGMVIVLVIPKAEENLIKVVTLLATLLTAAVGIGILANFNVDDGHLQFQANERWIEVINSRYHVGIDGISYAVFCLKKKKQKYEAVTKHHEHTRVTAPRHAQLAQQSDI